MKHRYNTFLFYALSISPALAVDLEVSGRAQIVAGIDDNVYFSDNSSKNGGYGAGRLRLRTDAIVSPAVRLNTEIQTGVTLGKDWPDRAGVTTGIYNKQREDFTLRKAYIVWNIPSSASQFNIGVDRIKLPSATFGNPILDASLGGVSYIKGFDDGDSMQLFFGKSIYDDEYVKDLYVATAMFEFKWADLSLKPYYAYSYYYYHNKANLGFVERLKESDINIAGLAASYDITNTLQFKFDVLYADQNNKKGVHYYEMKGYHSAAIFDFKPVSTTYGMFAWYSSGNDNKLDEQHDFGFVPIISTGGFSPMRFGFQSDDGFGRQGILSNSGAGTTGIGVHIKDIRTINRLTHTVRAAYIKGTTKDHGTGAPISANVPSLIRPHGEAGYMTNKDHAVEFNFDTAYAMSQNLTAKFDLGYIISGFSDNTYDKNPFNAQIGLNYQF